MSKVLITYLKIYDKFLDNGYVKAGPVIKDHVHKFFNLITKTEDPEYNFIKKLPNEFNANAEQKFNLKKIEQSEFTRTYFDIIQDIASSGCIIDGKYFEFNTTPVKYGLGFTDTENTSNISDADLDNAQIITSEPIFVMVTENKVIQDIKFVFSHLTTLQVNRHSLNKTVPEKYKLLIQDLKSQYVDGRYVKESVTEKPVYIIDTEVIGEYDKRDTTSNPDDLYKLLRISKVKPAYVKPDGKIFVVYNTITGEDLFKIKEDGTVYEGADIEVTTEEYYDFHSSPDGGLPTGVGMTKYSIKAKISGQDLTLSEIKADEKIVNQIDEKIQELFGAGTPATVSGVSSSFYNITANDVLSQPFAGLSDLCIDTNTNSYKKDEVIQYIETFRDITHIRHHNEWFKLNSFRKIKTADFNYLKESDNTRDSNTELVIYKGNCPEGKAFYVVDKNVTEFGEQDNIIGAVDLNRIKIIFRNNAEYELDVTHLGDQYTDTIGDILNKGSTGILEIKTDNGRTENIGDLRYASTKLGDYTTGINIYRPLKVTSTGDNYNAATIILDTKNNGISQDISFDIKTIEIQAEEPVSEINLEDIEVTIEKISM